MRGAQIQNITGRFGNIDATGLWDLATARQLDHLFLDARVITPYMISVVKTHGLTPGFIVDPSWTEIPDDPGGLATWTNNKLLSLGFSGTHAADPCDVIFDIEFKTPDYYSALLKAWRALRWKRQTYIAVPPNHAGDLPMADINVDINCIVLAETYYGEMQPVDPASCLRDLLSYGLEVSKGKIYYQTFWRMTGSSFNMTMPALDKWDGVLFDLDHA